MFLANTIPQGSVLYLDYLQTPKPESLNPETLKLKL